MRYMLDTNICIYAIRHKPEIVIGELNRHDPSDVCISSVTYAELVHGIEKSASAERNRLALSMLLANIEILNFDGNAADCYGRIRAELEKKGTPIGPLDTMIAGHAQSLGYTIVTSDVKAFRRIPDLLIENWSEGECISKAIF